MTQKTGGFMNMDYQYYNPRQAALTEARTLLTDAVRAAMADGSLPKPHCRISSWRSPPT